MTAILEIARKPATATTTDIGSKTDLPSGDQQCKIAVAAGMLSGGANEFITPEIYNRALEAAASRLKKIDELRAQGGLVHT